MKLERDALKRKVPHAPAGFSQIFLQSLGRMGVEVDEDKALPHGGMHRNEVGPARKILVKAGTVGHVSEAAFGVIDPAMKLTAQIARA